jgi:hypothetical protein
LHLNDAPASIHSFRCRSSIDCRAENVIAPNQSAGKDFAKNTLPYPLGWKSKLGLASLPYTCEAEESARQLALRGEAYTSEEHGEACSQRWDMMKSAGA